MFLKLKEIKKGQVFYECQYGYNIEWTAVSDPILSEFGVTLQASSKNGTVASLYTAYEHEALLMLQDKPCFFKADGTPNNLG